MAIRVIQWATAMRTEPLDKPRASSKRSPWLVFVIAVGVVLLGLIIHNARYGAVSPRIRNAGDTGGPHPLSDPLFGYGHWIVTIEIFSYLALLSIIALIAIGRRERVPAGLATASSV